MAPVKLKYIVSFTSQDDCHKANNLITGGGTRKWLCHPKDRNGRLEIVIQLEEATQFSFMDIGTLWCASLEIRVGRSDWPQTTEYQTLVPMVNLMSPIDCQLGRKTTNTQMFTSKDFSNAVVPEKWDRVQVICRQPYRKDMQLGISFIRIRNSVQATSNSTNGTKDKGPSEKKSPQGNKVMDIKRHFFGNSKENKGIDEDQLKQRLLQMSNSSDNGCDNMHEESLSRTAQLVLKASEKSKSNAHYTIQSNQCKRGLFSDTKTNKSGMTLQEEMAAFLPTLNLSMVDFDTVTVADLRHKFERKKKRKLSPQERRQFSEQCQSFMWQISENEISGHKNSSTTIKQPSLSSKTVESISIKVDGSSKTNGDSNSYKASINPAFRSPSSTKTSFKSNAKIQSSVKMSPAAIMRKRNNILQNELAHQMNDSHSKDSRHGTRTNKSQSKKDDSSSESDSSGESGSDICYNSSNKDDDSDRDSVKINDSSPENKPQIKRKLQTLEDVNRSYQDLYKTFSPSDSTDNDTISNVSSVKRKKLSSNSKKLVKVFDSEVSDNEAEQSMCDEPNTSNSKGWLSASKNVVGPNTAKKRKSVTTRVTKKTVTSSATKNSATSSVSNNSVSALTKTTTDKITPGISQPESYKYKIFRWPSKSQQKTNTDENDLLREVLRKGNESCSLLCKSCGFIIPQDTYAAHCSACILPAKTESKNITINKATTSYSQKISKTIDLTDVDVGSDVIDLTQSHFPQCPICLQQFPQEILMVHASECGL